MSRATVRSAVTTFFAAPNVANLNKVYPTFPKLMPLTDFRLGQPAGTASGGVGVVHIMSESEARRALGGAHSGKKQITYTIELQIFHHSTERDATDAMDAFDALIEAIKVRLRSDRNLGQDISIIWEAGEGGGIFGEYGEPKVGAGGIIECWGTIRFQVEEWITS